MKNRKLKQAIKSAPKLDWFECDDYKASRFPDGYKSLFGDAERVDGGWRVWIMSRRKEFLLPNPEAAKSFIEREYNRFIKEILGL